MVCDGDRSCLLIAAHGELGSGTINESILQLIEHLADRKIAEAISYGFIKGTPTIRDAVNALIPCKTMFVYPLFLANVYFAQNVLGDQLHLALQTGGVDTLKVLPNLGFDPGLGWVEGGRQRLLVRDARQLFTLAKGRSSNANLDWCRISSDTAPGASCEMTKIRVPPAFLY